METQNAGLKPRINRRQALSGTVTALLLARCGGRLPRPDPAPNVLGSFVDAHCHVFNAHDIPVEPFLLETALEEKPDKKAWAPLAKLIVRIIAKWLTEEDLEARLLRSGAFEQLSTPLPPQDEDALFGLHPV
jgi:hypothetical protein